MKFNNYNERMIAKYVLLFGLFHQVYSNYNTFGIVRAYSVPYETTPLQFNVLQTQGGTDNFFGLINDVRLRSQQTSKLQPSYVKLIKSQPGNIQLSNPQLIKSQLNSPKFMRSQPSNPQVIKSQQNKLLLSNPQLSYSQLRNPQSGDPQKNTLQSRKSNVLESNVKLKNGNNGNIVYSQLKVPPRQARLQQEKLNQRLKQEAVDRLKQQQALEELQQQAVERLRQQAVEKLKQRTIDALKQQQKHLSNLLENVKQIKEENQKRNSETLQRIVKQRNKHIQRRFYEHALHDDDDDDENDNDDND